MNKESFWIEIIVEGEEDKDYTVPFYPQEYEDDKEDVEE